MSARIRVAVLGAEGRMGSEVCRAVEAAPDLELVARIDQGQSAADAKAAGAQVAVDFTHPDVVMESLESLIGGGIHCVVGTTGFDAGRLATLAAQLERAPGVGVLVAPNFGLGAVLMMRFAREAAAHFESAEIVELHHPDKADAPSGTARATAEVIASARRVRRPRAAARRDVVRAARRPRRRHRRRAGALGARAGAGGPSGGRLRRPRRDVDDPPRLSGPRLVHAGRAARLSARSPTTPASRWAWTPTSIAEAPPVIARRIAYVLLAALAFYVALSAYRGWQLASDGGIVALVLGASVLAVAAIGFWIIYREIRFGLDAQALGHALGEEGGLPEALPRLPSGRPDRDAADREYELRKGEVEQAPDDWRCWYRLALAYGDAGDSKRGRAACATPSPCAARGSDARAR